MSCCCMLLHQYTKVYNQNKESSHLMTILISVDSFKWEKNIKVLWKFHKHNENSDKGYIFEVDVEYPKNLHDLHNDWPFSPERLRIKKCQRLVCHLYNKWKYVVHTYKNFKTSTKLWNNTKKAHRITKFNQKAWLKPYINMNTKLGTEAKSDVEKDFFKLMNNRVFRKTLDNVRRNKDIRLVRTDKRRNYLVPGPNYHATKWFSQN